MYKREHSYPELDAYEAEKEKLKKEQEAAEADELSLEPTDPGSELEATADEKPDTSATSSERPSVEENAYKARYDSLKAHHDKTIRGLRDEVAQLKQQIVTSANGYMPRSKEDLEAWATENPDVYNILVSIAAQQFSEKEQMIQTRLRDVEEESLKVRRDRAMVTLKKLHPDFDEIRDDPKFHTWAKEQPDQIQAWIYQNPDDPHLCSKAIKLYKAEAGITDKPVVKKTPDGAAFVKTKGDKVNPEPPQKKVWTTSEIAKLTPRQFEKYEDEIGAARREGRIREN